VKKIAGAIVLALWATWLIMLMPAMAFRLKRAAFNLMASSAHNLADSPARIHASKSVGIYLLERKAFDAVGLAPPHEVPLDLIARSVFIASWLAVGVGGWFTAHSSERWVSIVFIAPSLFAAYRTTSAGQRGVRNLPRGQLGGDVLKTVGHLEIDASEGLG